MITGTFRGGPQPIDLWSAGTFLGRAEKERRGYIRLTREHCQWEQTHPECFCISSFFISFLNDRVFKCFLLQLQCSEYQGHVSFFVMKLLCLTSFKIWIRVCLMKSCKLDWIVYIQIPAHGIRLCIFRLEDSGDDTNHSHINVSLLTTKY